MPSFATFGNDLYTGKRSFDFTGRRRLWYLVASCGILLAIVLPWLRGGFNLGIEFRGGSQFQIARVANPDTIIGERAVTSVVPKAAPSVSGVGGGGVQVQTDRLSDDQTVQVKNALAEAYRVSADDVTSSFIGPSWGADVTDKAVRGLIIFIVLAGATMALYFRTWKMSASALIALFHDLIITAGVYGAVGFEVTPAAVIGLLTILGYSLYDTVVVFDKVRENTADYQKQTKRSWVELVNLAVNQTLVRSINTSVVAVLPVAAILFIGAFLLGAGTLRDISLALFIGIIVGTYSTIFIAAPIYAELREREPEIAAHAERVRAARRAEQDGKAAEPVLAAGAPAGD